MMRRRGFTLMELLVVIAIMSVLIGLLMPALSAARHMARKTRAKSDVRQIETAIKAYYNDFRSMPSIGGQMNQSAILILRGDNNARKICYLEFSDDDNINEGFVDPWGEMYRVAVSQDGVTVSAGNYGSLHRVAAVWSKGENGREDGPGTDNDDIRSWK